MESNKYTKTTNFNLATYLYAKNQQIAGAEAINSKQKEFVFMKTDELDELVENYKFPDIGDEENLVNVKKYEQARRELLDLIKQ